ncbi:unnamed protein product [Ceutorhynchus assimilis]|uniref:Uncharacterized protein n=1 Tax=Ceutorhynchus assimilis TaxID=467358 RepID=A0A9N9MKV6_9CUCU|nr:unnamed protein product [Ceutorhynchus assimilis]
MREQRPLSHLPQATGLHPPDPTQVLKRIPDGVLIDNQAVRRTLDASLIDLLKEHRGIGSEAKKRKRGKKIQPGKNLATSTPPEPTPEPRDASTPEPEDESIPEPRDSPSRSNLAFGGIDETLPDLASTSGLSFAALKKGKKPRKKMTLTVEVSQRQKRRDNSSKCGICLCNWKDYSRCQKWICGPCNNGSKDPYFVCERCDDSEDEGDEMCDDSDADKDFDPDDGLEKREVTNSELQNSCDKFSDNDHLKHNNEVDDIQEFEDSDDSVKDKDYGPTASDESSVDSDFDQQEVPLPEITEADNYK